MRRAVVVYNPVAGGSRGAAASERAQRRLAAAGFVVERYASTRESGATAIARRAATADLIVAVGGDGTLREVVEGLADAGSATAVAIVPMGNANVVAHEMGIPTDVDGAIELAVGGHPVQVDLGRVRTDEHEGLFLAMVGVGWDADTVRLLDRWRHTSLGRRAYRSWADGLYAAAGLAAALRPRQARFTLSVDGGPPSAHEYRAAVLCNLRTYGKSMSLTPDASYDSGLIHVQARRSALPPVLAWQLGAAVLERRSPAFVADYVEGRAFELRGADRFPVQVDGDERGWSRRLEVGVIPGGFRLLVPRAGG